MAQREMIAWLTVVALIATYTYYFLVAGPAVRFGEDSLTDFVFAFAPVAIVHAVAMGVGTLAIRAHHSSNDLVLTDERDRQIAERSLVVGYIILLGGLIFVGLVLPFSEPPFKILNVTLAVIVLAEIVRYGSIILRYRLSHHG